MADPTRIPVAWKGLRRALVAGVVLGLLAVPAVSRAGVTCSFAGATVSITLGAVEDAASVVREGEDIVVRDGTGGIIPCGAPTTTITDTIQVSDPTIGTTSFTIDLSGGPFAPGLTDEGGGADTTDEIEFWVDLFTGFPDRLAIVGSANADDILFSSGGINLNNGVESPSPVGRDFDVTGAGVEDHVVNGGEGADTIRGEAPLTASFGAKLILNGQGGADELIGGTAADVLSGGDGADELRGIEGADDLDGGLGLDLLFGGGGDDELFGGGDADELDGGEGADRLDGQGGADLEFGDVGDDVFDQGPSANGGDDLLGGGGVDLATYDLRTQKLAITIGAGAIGNDGELGEGDDVGADVEAVRGGVGDDTITGDIGDNTIRGGPGADTLGGGDGNDVVDGDAGDDRLLGGSGMDTVSFFGAPAVTASLAAGSATGDGSDSLSGFENLEGGSRADTLAGDGGRNVLTGRGGADILSGSDQDDELHGGEGNDTLSGEQGNDLVKGNGGIDTASFAASLVSVTVDLGTNTATGEGADSLVGIENAVGGPADDVLIGSSQPNVLVGNGGADRIFGSDGGDDLRGSAGDDSIDAGPGDDVVAGGDGHDILSGVSGADTFLEGEQRRPNGGDSVSGGPGRDLVTYGGRKNRVRVTVGAAKGDGGRREGDRVGGDIERVRGTRGGDVLIGNGGRNTLLGGAGDDRLEGRGGRDRLVGGAGDDYLDGGPQADACRGGSGKNVLKDCGRKRRR